MNPIAYYLTHNKELSEYLGTYFEYANNISNLEIRNTVDDIKNTGTSMEKIQAVSLLAAIKLFFV